jgi:hypothetical protein
MGNMLGVNLATPKNEHQQSANHFGCCILYNQRAVLQHLLIIEVLAVFICNIASINIAIHKIEHPQSVNRVSTECQQSINNVSTEHPQWINNIWCCILYNPRTVWRHLPINEVLAMFMGNIVSVNIATPKNEHQQSVNNFGCCIMYNSSSVLWYLSTIKVWLPLHAVW